ncbi:MAG: acyl-CoA dehydrogenase [Gammaproteobacteria bacterium]|nr:MAG: acyl-CoA dehydrogenase [Gammaproteobacteria bacterium]
MDFSVSDKAQDYIERVKTFIQNEILPIEEDYFKTLKALDNSWVVLPIVEELKAKAKAQGLWNMFLPMEEYGPGLKNVEYALVAEETGKSFLAPEIFNCEPGVASSDATNMAATAIVDGDEVVLNGRKWWSTGIGHPDCEILIFMGLTDPSASRHAQHSMVLVPRNTPGVKVESMLTVFGDYDEPYGHGEVSFTDVRLPKSAIIAGPGRGFEIAQGRLGPGRIHHCMRAIGAAERTLEMLIKRGASREAFGKKLISLGGNPDIVANARISIEQARLLTLKAAWMLDVKGVKAAMSEVSQIKVVAPNILQTIVDQAIQIYGGAGVSDDFGLTQLYAYARCLRLADGPDEVHRGLIAKFELAKHGIRSKRSSK